MKYFTYFYIIKLKDMRIIREFACELTGDECLIIRDEKGDETCMLKEDYDNLDKYEKFEYYFEIEEEKSYKKASKRFA